jgi:hypothetical protein
MVVETDRTIISNRNCLSLLTVEALQLQKNWLNNRAVESPLFKLSESLLQKSSGGAQRFNSRNFSD